MKALSVACGLFLLSGTLCAQTRVTGKIVDAQTGALLPARLEILSDKGVRYEAKSADPLAPAIPYKRQAGTLSIEHHVTLNKGAFTADLPPGTYTFTAQRGKEYLVDRREVKVEDSPLELVLKPRRWIDMPSLGWYSGDVHSHRLWTEMKNLCLAEDVHLSFPLSNWVTSAEAGLVSGNKIRDGYRGSPQTLIVDKNHLIHFQNAEFEIFSVKGKNHTLGAILGIGMNALDDDHAPPLAPFVEKVRAQGGLTDLEKHSWPWSLAIAATHKVDLFELANNHVWQTRFGFPSWTIEESAPYMGLERTTQGLSEWGWIDFGFQTYYALLNCGLRIMPSAGTGSGVHPVAHGFSRVYAKIDGPLELKKWLEALKAGKSFVTTGPLLRAEIDGKTSGETFQGPFAKPLHLRAIVHSSAPIERIEVLFNGVLIHQERPMGCPRDEGGNDTVFSRMLTTEQSGWYVVRVFEKHPDGRVRFAHTAPWFVNVPGKPLRPRKEELDHILKTIDREIARNTNVLDAKSLAEILAARKYYARLGDN